MRGLASIQHGTTVCKCTAHSQASAAGGANRLFTEWVAAPSVQADCIPAQSCSAADEGAHVAWLLHALQHQQPLQLRWRRLQQVLHNVSGAGSCRCVVRYHDAATT